MIANCDDCTDNIERVFNFVVYIYTSAYKKAKKYSFFKSIIFFVYFLNKFVVKSK